MVTVPQTMSHERGECGCLLLRLWGCCSLLDQLVLLSVSKLSVPHTPRRKNERPPPVLLAIAVLALVFAAIGEEDLAITKVGLHVE